MLIGIYNSKYPDFHAKSNSIYKNILNYNDIPFVELNLDQSDFWENLKKIDFFIFNWATPDDHQQIAKTILPIVDKQLKIKCFPNLNTCWHYDDKIKEYYLLKTKGYPFVESWIFWEKENALKWAENAKYPVVFKLKKGAASKNVILIKNKIEAEWIINKMFGKGINGKGIPHRNNIKYQDLVKLFRRTIDNYLLNKLKDIQPNFWQVSKNYVLFQKFLPNNSFDTRITTIGNKIFSNRRFVRKGDFRASGSGKSDFDKNNIDLRMVKIAQKISKEMNFQTMAYDFLLNENGDPEICEVSYDYAFKSILWDYGYWDENLNWHQGKFWPQYLHLQDLLSIPSLKQPELALE